MDKTITLRNVDEGSLTFLLVKARDKRFKAEYSGGLLGNKKAQAWHALEIALREAAEDA